MTTWIAIYGALVATGGFVWQIVSWRMARATRLSGSVTYIPHLPAITVGIVNHSSHDVRVTTINLLWNCNGQGGGRMLAAQTDTLLRSDRDPVMLRAMSDLPSVIRPHDSGSVQIGGERLRVALPDGMTDLRALVGTADGKRIEIPARLPRGPDDVVRRRRRLSFR